MEFKDFSKQEIILLCNQFYKENINKTTELKDLDLIDKKIVYYFALEQYNINKIREKQIKCIHQYLSTSNIYCGIKNIRLLCKNCNYEFNCSFI
jgi:hypothetical protein